MTSINENDVLQYTHENGNRIRIIWVSSDMKFSAFINLDCSTSMPILAETREIEEMVASSELIKVPDTYVFYYNEDELPNNFKQKRNELWEIVNYLWIENREQILIKNSRSKIIFNAARKFNMTHLQIRRIISKFWQGGMVRNALLPEYKKCGGKGKKRKIRKICNDKLGIEEEIKRGRKAKPDMYGEEIKGVNIDENKLNIIILSIEMFYKKDKISIQDAFDKMISRFFTYKYKSNGNIECEIYPKEKRITYDQFYYWLKKYEEEKYRYLFVNRHSQKEFDLKLRELLGNSTIESFGPGSRYQIDATIAGVYLVSSINPDKIIGKPVVYIVIDVYSRLVVGVYVGLEGPSWIGAMMALDNVVEDKVEFCKKYNVEITSKEWPNSYLPEILLADNGEFEGYNPGNLINNLNVHVENASTYRGDSKGIVERHFRTTKDRIKHKTPGAINKEFRERGDKDYRLDAALTLKEFTSVIIQGIIIHNNTVVKNYPREKGLIQEGIVPIPVQIWNWGLKNRKCCFVKKDRRIIRLNLLYRGRAIIKREGIKFNKSMFYSCEKAIEDDWFINCVNNKIDIVYDPRDMDYIYIPTDEGNSFIECNLLDKCESYKGLPLEEIIFMQELEIEQIQDHEEDKMQRKVDYISGIEKVIKNANERKHNVNKESKRSRISGISSNRSQEKNLNRQNEKFNLGNKDIEQSDLNNSDLSNIEKNNDKCNENKTYPKMDLLKKVREKHI